MDAGAFLRRIREAGIVPVVKISGADKAAALARALLEGGLPAAEITFRTDAAAASIAAIAREVPEVLVCAGTVLTVDTAKQAVDAGAAGIICPGTNPAVVEWCLDKGVPVLPGCATPTEVEACMRMGLGAVKLFPASVIGGVEMLKALSGPYGSMLFMPTGGIRPENAGDYLALSNVLAVGGSWIASERDMAAGDFESIREKAAAAKGGIPPR